MKRFSKILPCLGALLCMAVYPGIVWAAPGDTGYTLEDPDYDEDGNVIEGTGTCTGTGTSKGAAIGRFFIAFNLPPGADIPAPPDVTPTTVFSGSPTTLFPTTPVGDPQGDADQAGIVVAQPGNSNWIYFSTGDLDVPLAPFTPLVFTYSANVAGYAGAGIGEVDSMTVWVSDSAGTVVTSVSQVLIFGTPTPALSEWGLVILALTIALTGVAFVVWRKENKRRLVAIRR